MSTGRRRYWNAKECEVVAFFCHTQTTVKKALVTPPSWRRLGCNSKGPDAAKMAAALWDSFLLPHADHSPCRVCGCLVGLCRWTSKCYHFRGLGDLYRRPTGAYAVPMGR